MMFSTRGAILLLITFALIAALAAAITIAAMQAAGPGAPPLVYSAQRYAPFNPVLCPGEALRFPVKLWVEASPERPVITSIVRTIWSFDRQRTVIPDTTQDWSVFMEPAVISTTTAYTIPLGLPPGAYELRTGRIAEAREARGFAIVFVIPKRCAQ